MTQEFPYETAVDPVDVGMDSRGVQWVVSSFCKQQQQGVCPDGQLIVRRGGKVVLKLVYGTAH